MQIVRTSTPRHHDARDCQIRSTARAFAFRARSPSYAARSVFCWVLHNVFGISIIPPHETYITYQVYIVPGFLGIIQLFHGMQSSTRAGRQQL